MGRVVLLNRGLPTSQRPLTLRPLTKRPLILFGGLQMSPGGQVRWVSDDPITSPEFLKVYIVVFVSKAKWTK